MGLFGKKEKPPCAICGGKVSGLFPPKIDGQLVCKECYGDVDLPQEVLDYMTVEAFRHYMDFREENAQLRQRFKITRQVDFGWLGDKFVFDTDNRLLCMDKNLTRTIFEGSQVKSFEIREDRQLLFRGSAEGLTRYTSMVPERVTAMAPQIDRLRMQAHRRREMERRMEEQGENGYYPMPDMKSLMPFLRFHVDIYFEHPYFNVYTAEKEAPEFDSTDPDINDYLEHYNEDTALMEELARALMKVAFPGAPERTVGSADAPASGVAADTASELQRFQDLMDKGILTEEEFNAKKRKLLGI